MTVPSKTSMFYWWPKVKDLEILVPKTELIRHEGAFSGNLNLGVLDGEEDQDFENLIRNAREAAKGFAWPIFIRSDVYSGKHSWKRTCFVKSGKDIDSHIYRIFDRTFAEFGLDFFGIAVREFLELAVGFTAFDDMPIAVERRYFVRDGKVECWHPYWPPASIRKPSVQNWREILRRLQTSSEEEVAILTEYAERIGKKLGGYWSVDFCRTNKGEWYFIDMAEGGRSYHWGTCPKASPYWLKYYGDPLAVDERVLR